MTRASRGILRPYLAMAVVAVLTLVLAMTVASCKSTPAAPASASPTPQPSGSTQSLHLDHVFVILEENKSYSQIVGSSAAPYINDLIKHYALSSDYFALFHPSLPNYIALTSGSNDGITDDRGAVGNEVAVTNIATA